METHRLVKLESTSTSADAGSLSLPRISLKKRNFSSISTSSCDVGKCSIGATIPPPLVIPRSITPDLLIPALFEKHNGNANADADANVNTDRESSAFESQDNKKLHTPTIVRNEDDVNDRDCSPIKRKRTHLDPSETNTLSFSSSFSLYSPPRARTTLKKHSFHFNPVPTMDPVSVIRRQFSESVTTLEDSWPVLTTHDESDSENEDIGNAACQQHQGRQEGMAPRRVSFEELVDNFSTPPPNIQPPAFPGCCMRQVVRKRLEF